MPGESMNATIYQRWKDASPTLSFPFQFRGRGYNVQQSWGDVQERLRTDGSNPCLHRTTSHFTPTNYQSALIKQEIRKEKQALSPRLPSVNSPYSRSYVSPRKPHEDEDEEAEQPTEQDVSPSLHLSPSGLSDDAEEGSSNGSNVPSPPGAAPLKAPRPNECPPLLKSLGRVAYMDHKRRLPSREDRSVAGFCPTSRNYGIVAHNPPKPNKNAKDFRRSCHGLRDTYRQHGIFPRSDL